VLSWGVSWGYRNVVTAKTEVKQASDLKGLKIRTIPTKVFVSAINAMGANKKTHWTGGLSSICCLAEAAQLRAHSLPT
jgi:hypothetical protein